MCLHSPLRWVFTLHVLHTVLFILVIWTRIPAIVYAFACARAKSRKCKSSCHLIDKQKTEWIENGSLPMRHHPWIGCGPMVGSRPHSLVVIMRLSSLGCMCSVVPPFRSLGLYSGIVAASPPFIKYINNGWKKAWNSGDNIQIWSNL